MQEKVTQLLEILDVAKKNAPPEMKAWQGYESNFPFHLLELEFSTDKPLCERLGVSRGVFPSVDELADEEVEAVVAKILELWECFHYYAEVLEQCPARKAYTQLLSVWEESVPMYAMGGFHFDFYDEDLDDDADEMEVCVEVGSEEF